MRIALFGGSFDPPHRGHAAVAVAAARAFDLDEVIVAPTGRQPLKLQRPATAFEDRLRMAVAACADLDLVRASGSVSGSASGSVSGSQRGEGCGFSASDLDRPKADGWPNYTVETLGALRAARPGDEIFNLVGADAFLSLPKWKGFPELLDLAEWIVVSRPGFAVSEQELAGMGLSGERLGRVHRLEGLAEEVSATELRERLSRGEPCGDLISPGVAEYIVQRGLYRV